MILMTPVRALDLLPDFFGTKEPEGTYIWQSTHQYVKVVKRDKDAGPGANQHPADISREQLRTVLNALSVTKDTGLMSEQKENIPLFVPSEASVLSDTLARGLAHSKPDEDVIFLVVGMHQGTIAKERMGISGRVFYEDGRLNLILGDVHKSLSGPEEQKQRNMAAGCGDCPVDERMDPFKIAVRGEQITPEDPVALIEGLDFKEVNGKKRPDWLLLDVPKIVAAIDREKNKLPPSLEKERARAQAETAKANAERRQMREEMARMRKEMQEKGGGTSAKSVEERMATLEQLKKKGLISDEEYQARRKEILNDI